MEILYTHVCSQRTPQRLGRLLRQVHILRACERSGVRAAHLCQAAIIRRCADRIMTRRRAVLVVACPSSVAQ